MEVHNASLSSGDIVFGLSMEVVECHFDFPISLSPPIQTVEQCRSATIGIEGFEWYGYVLLPPDYRWMKNGVPFPSAISNVLHIPSVSYLDAGGYSVDMLTPCGLQQGMNSALFVVPDNTPPQPLRAMVNSGLTNVIVTFSEPLDAASIDATNFIVDDVCLPGRLKTQVATLLNPTNVLVTTTPRQLDQNYVVSVSGIRDACVGNVLTTKATVMLSPNVTLNPLSLLLTSTGAQITWVGCGVLQWTSNLVQWADVPGTPSSPYSVNAQVGTRFFRLRLPLWMDLPGREQRASLQQFGAGLRNDGTKLTALRVS